MILILQTTNFFEKVQSFVSEEVINVTSLIINKIYYHAFIFFTNFCESNNEIIAIELQRLNLVSTFVKGFESIKDVESMQAWLTGINLLFELGEIVQTDLGCNTFVEEFKSLNGVYLMEKLIASENQLNYIKCEASRILSKYFDDVYEVKLK